MNIVTIPPENLILSTYCPTRRAFLAREHDAWTRIRDAERPGLIPIEELVNFQSWQRARWAHEDNCAQCAVEIGAAA
jgi:hypothetical protein